MYILPVSVFAFLIFQTGTTGVSPVLILVASYSIESDGQLRTSLYDKRDDFNFHITNFPFLSSNIPSSPAYGVFISQLIRYARACSSYECFILRAARLSFKLLRQGYVMERLKSSLRKFYGLYGDLINHYMKSPSPKCYMTFWDMTKYNDTLNWSDITPICELITELDFNTDFDLITEIGGFHRTLQRVWLANRGRLHLRTPGPVPFVTCICSYVETILPWTCHVYGPFEFRTSLGTYVLLNVPIQAPTMDHPFYGCSEKPPNFNRLLRRAPRVPTGEVWDKILIVRRLVPYEPRIAFGCVSFFLVYL